MIRRASDVLWRLAPHLVLLRRIADPDDMVVELAGGAALLWLALDEPRTAAELAEAFEVEVDEVRLAIDLLEQRGLVDLS